MRTFSALTFLVLLAGAAAAQNQPDHTKDLRSAPYDPNEPIRPTFSLAKATEYLDLAAQDWMRARSCGGCHANFAYMMVRPRLSKEKSFVFDDTRRYLEERVERWSKVKAGEFQQGASLRAEKVSMAAALAVDDARTGRLQPSTVQALNLLWDFQKGKWEQDGCGGGDIVPELTREYSAALAIVGALAASDQYARANWIKEGLTKARQSLRYDVKRSPHNQALTLWASTRLDGMLTSDERANIIQTLLAQQKSDGGWSLALLTRPQLNQTIPPPSDGYGTGFVIYVLRQAGVPANRPELVRAVDWLRKNQRVSGQWFTPFRRHMHTTEANFGTRGFYFQNNGTAFALLALDACDALKAKPARPSRRAAGLMLHRELRLID